MKNATAEMFDIRQYVFVVADYIDQVKKRKRKLFEADEQRRTRFGYNPTPVFETEYAALDFIVNRAVMRVVEAQAAIKKADRALANEQRRLAKCEALLAACPPGGQDGGST